MSEEKLLVRLSGAVAEMLKELVKRGYFSTKAEAVRAGILRLGHDYGLVKPATHYWRQLQMEIRASGKRMTHKEIEKALRLLEQKA